MQTSTAGIAFIKTNEGFVAHVYDDNGKPCIGYGHDLLPEESFPHPITEDEAELLLRGDLALIEVTLNIAVPQTCTQNQFDALCDFAYNAGIGSLKKMLGHGWSQVAAEMPRWQYEDVDGIQKINPGLAARRAKEVALFNS